jgi:hypothetical protein
MPTMDKLKFFLLKTPFAKQIRVIERQLIVLKIKRQSVNSITQRTVYCISPYKTGTTYLSSNFNPEISKHEPISFTSYKYLDKDFDRFFVKRLNYLSLKLECSGLWSAYVEELSKNDIAKHLNYICILRSPSSWITSVINYWNKPNELDFDIVHECFFKGKLGVDLRQFNFEVDSKTNQFIINKLIEFYFDFTEKTSQLSNVAYMHIEDIQGKLPYIESLLGELSCPKYSWKRTNNKKQFVYKNVAIDEDYKKLTNQLIKEKSKF